MSDRPRSAISEAVWIADILRRRMTGGGSKASSDDVWADATRDDRHEHFATGAPECRYCPICRAMAATRSSGPGVVGHLVGAGESLLAAAREAVSGFDRGRPGGRAGERHDDPPRPGFRNAGSPPDAG